MVTLLNSADLNIANSLLVDQEPLWQLSNILLSGDHPSTADDLSNLISNLGETSTVSRINSQVSPTNTINENSLLLPASAAYYPIYSAQVNTVNVVNTTNNTSTNNSTNSQPNYDSLTNYTQTTNNIQIDALLGKTQWYLDSLQHQITYAFPTSRDTYTDQIPANATSWQELSEETKRKARLVFTELEKIIPIDFVEVPYTNNNPAEIVLLGANFTNVCGGYTYYPGTGAGGNVFFNDISCQGDWGYELVPHEIGHALGLKHPGYYGNSGESPYLPTNQDNTDWTVMSYNVGQQPINGFQASLYKVLDISALQYLYSNPI